MRYVLQHKACVCVSQSIRRVCVCVSLVTPCRRVAVFPTPLLAGRGVAARTLCRSMKDTHVTAKDTHGALRDVTGWRRAGRCCAHTQVRCMRALCATAVYVIGLQR